MKIQKAREFMKVDGKRCNVIMPPSFDSGIIVSQYSRSWAGLPKKTVVFRKRRYWESLISYKLAAVLGGGRAVAVLGERYWGGRYLGGGRYRGGGGSTVHL